jgi:hypothetical protein
LKSAGKDLIPSGIRDNNDALVRGIPRERSRRDTDERGDSNEGNSKRPGQTFGEAHADTKACKGTRPHSDPNFMKQGWSDACRVTHRSQHSRKLLKMITSTWR